MTPGRVVGLVVAVLMIVLGGLWTLGGSSFLGPLVAGLGVALGWVVVQRIRERDQRPGPPGRYG